MRRQLISTAAVTITDPLVKYQSLVQTGVYLPDPAQHRLALHLQKLYKRLKDYVPSPEYRTRLRQVTKAVQASSRSTVGDDLAAPGHPLRRNPLFARFFRPSSEEQVAAEAKALTRVLTSHQAALEADSPRGLFVSGEVGTGKSMLLDLLAEGLPTRLKRRWHFNTFMLHAFSRLEQYRREQGVGDDATQYSLIWLAKEMVESSPILFLDEFQLPDRAASKLLSNLFIAFFQLGGVLVASSNRVPEELERASGVTFTPPALGGLIHRLFVSRGTANPKSGGQLFGSSSDFAAFLEVLKARCDFFHIEGAKDWRRRDDTIEQATAYSVRQNARSKLAGFPHGYGTGAIGHLASQSSATPESKSKHALPQRYLLSSDADVTDDILAVLGTASADWQPAELSVYGRRVLVPKQRQGVTLWTFEEIVASLGPADYITLASNYHTFIIDDVPVLPTSKKNEARRFITFLDALYEARCKLIVRAQAGPDDIFFPDMRPSISPITMTNSSDTTSRPMEDGDATYSETVAEVYQDQLAPFRPNISTYESEARTSKYDPDQDSDFGLEDAHSPKVEGSAHGNKHAVNFADAGAFTGEDERFAYRRAASRLWELCSARWHAREESGWWRPLPIEARHWEGRSVTKPISQCMTPNRSGHMMDAQMGESITLDEPAGLERFRLAELKKKQALIQANDCYNMTR